MQATLLARLDLLLAITKNIYTRVVVVESDEKFKTNNEEIYFSKQFLLDLFKYKEEIY